MSEGPDPSMSLVVVPDQNADDASLRQCDTFAFTLKTPNQLNQKK